MVGLIKICVNMDEEKNRKKIWENEGERQGGKKKKREKSQLTLGQYVGPTNSWKILSDDKWVMVSNGCGILKWWVMSDEWQKLSDEKYASKQGLTISIV